MMRFSRRVFTSAPLLSAVANLPENADGIEQSSQGLHDIYVSKPCVTSGIKNGDADILIVFENSSAEMVFLDGVTSDVTSDGDLYFKDLVGSTIAQNGFGVDEGEILDVSSSHIGARLTGLKQDLDPGDHLSVFLKFRHGILEVPAHVMPRGQC